MDIEKVQAGLDKFAKVTGAIGNFFAVVATIPFLILLVWVLFF